jgi:hypothetical protein
MMTPFETAATIRDASLGAFSSSGLELQKSKPGVLVLCPNRNMTRWIVDPG